MNPGSFGLITQGHNVPLEGVKISARLTGVCAEVTVSQRYHNREAVDVEAVYVFPLEEGAAICDFRARVGDRLLQGQVQEREQAFETYDDAMAAGHGAFLLDQERPNVFTASVGNLKPQTTVEIEVTYVAQLQREGRAVRFALPTTVSPRYAPARGPEVGQPDAERINPPRAAQVPYGLHLDVQIEMASNLRVVESPSHQVRVELDGHKALVTLSSREVALDRDFVLLFEEKDAGQPGAYVAQEEDGTRVAMITFSPQEADIPRAGGQEIIFVLDCSGSMSGDSIQEARRALELCVRAMSEGDTFNIYRFGSSYQSLWPEARPYNQQNLETASLYARNTEANLGGTEIFAPLQVILSHPRGAQLRQVLLLTDGQVSNEAAVIELCKQNASKARVFAFGIGAGVSEHLVRGVARASGGAAEFIYPGERIEPKVLRMFGRVTTPALGEVLVDWGGLDVEAAPAVAPPVFGGDTMTVFGRVRGGQGGEVTLRAGALKWSVQVDLEEAHKGGPIPTLWARAAIRELEEGGNERRGSNQARPGKEERKREKLIALATKYKLMSSATSFVAVEHRAEADKSAGQAQLRRVPVATTQGWHGQGSVRAQASKTFSGAMPQGMPPGMPSPMAPPPPSAAPYPASPPPFGAPSGAPSKPAARPAPAPASRDSRFDMMEMERERGVKAEERKEGFVDKLKRKVGLSSAPPEPITAAAPRYEAEAVAELAMDDFADAPALEESADHLFDLLLSQQADGSFRFSAALERWLGARLGKVKAAAAQDGEALVVTAVVVALLEKEASHRRAEWATAARKATRWLDQQPGRFDAAALL
jgi:Ca-activated chloride channel family protein